MKTSIKKLNIKYILPALLLGLMVSCTDDPASSEEDGAGEEELITQVNLSLEGDDGSNATVSWSDEDGPGGNDPQIGTLQLQSGATYTGTIELSNTTESPVEDITAEVREEDDEHQFFYTVGGGISDRMTVEITDTDADGLPVGLEYTVSISEGDAASGTLNVVLSHYDDAPKDGTTRSDETDIDIDIPVEIQTP
jgi:hypothetical protein